MDPCTRAEAMRILRVIVARYQDPAAPPADIAANVARLQTLSDDDLTVLSQSPDTFAINESNRRLSVALRAEAARTTRLTRWVVGLTWGVFALTAVLVWVALSIR
jgi:hypothetical protein